MNTSGAEWIFLAIVAFAAYKLYIGFRDGRERLVCKSCGHVGEGKTATSGSVWIEIVLWLCLIVPGVIYTIWRLTTRGNACELCGSRDLIPAESPIGKQILEQLQRK